MKISTKYKVLLLAVLLLGSALFAGYIYLSTAFEPLNPSDAATYDIEIPKGATAHDISSILIERQIIEEDFPFRLYLKLTGLGSQLKAGHYSLSPSMNIPTLTKELVEGKGITVKFTIPEGYTLIQIKQVLVDKGLMSNEEFVQLIEQADFPEVTFVAELTKGKNRLEGYLFPDTYVVDKGASPREVILMMLKRFEAVYQSLPENQTDLSFQEIVILASLIEKEARVDKDRSLIASVYLNRLNQNMYLQCDATVQYALPEHKDRLFFSDYEIDSPYNTYRNPGLPPGAIASPGEKSLAAAHQPATSDYLFYLWDKSGSGEHVFAATHREHVENREKYGYN